MDITARTGGPGKGIFPTDQDVRVVARDALTAGDLCQFDFGNVSTHVTTITPGKDTSGFASVLDPVTTDLQAGIFAIALEDIGEDASGMVRLRGIVLANVDSSTVAGSELVPAVDGQLDLASLTGLKIVAIALEAAASNFATVLFDGVTGFGMAART